MNVSPGNYTIRAEASLQTDVNPADDRLINIVSIAAIARGVGKTQ